MKKNKIATHTEISARAEVIWRERGCIQGQDNEIWLEAERQLHRRRSRRAAAGHLTEELEQHLADIAPPPADRSPTSL